METQPQRINTTETESSALANKSASKNITAAQSRLSAQIPFFMPSGSVIAYAGEICPDGFLFCDGSYYDKEIYYSLFEVIEYSFGGSGQTFSVPDLRGRVIVAPDLDTNNAAAGRLTTNRELRNTGGSETNTLTSSQIPPHKHSVYAIQATNTTVTGAGNRLTFVADGPGANIDDGLTSETGGGDPHPNLQPYMVLNYIIKF